MNTNRDQLDDAIDHVAKRLTHVDDDAQFSARVIAALPERVTWFGWLTHSWAPRLAMMAIVASASVLWSSRQSTTELPAILVHREIVSPPYVPADVEPVEPVRTKPLERVARAARVEPLEPLEPFQGLPSIDAPKAIAVNEVSPESLPSESALSVKPIVITELPLTAEFPERH